MKYFYAKFNGHRFETIPFTFNNLKSLINSVFPDNDFHWSFNFTDNSMNCYIFNNEQKIELFMFEPNFEVNIFEHSDKLFSEIHNLQIKG